LCIIGGGKQKSSFEYLIYEYEEIVTMSIKKLLIISVVFLTISFAGLFADPVTLTMDDLVQIGETQGGNNNSLDAAIALTGINDLEWGGGYFETSYLWVWDYNNGIFWWWGKEDVTHLSIKAGNQWILYELETPLQQGGFIALESEMFNKKGKPKNISHVTAYTGGVAQVSETGTSVPEPATFFLLGLGLLAVPGIKKVMHS
jgi:PEP-CTERM motif